jgi:Cu2+-exporting ATPase
MNHALRPPSAAACPGCVATPVTPVEAAPKDARIALSLPAIHCQACISTVERALAGTAGVTSSRVNLTLKRVMVQAEASVHARDLIAVLAAVGHEAHELDQSALQATQTDRAGRELLMRLAVAGFASMNVMLLSVSVWAGASDATRDMFHWISAAITFPAIGFAAQPFFRNAYSALRVGRLNMDVPIVLAIVLALITSLWETMLSGQHAYFDAALTLTFFLLAGRYLDHRTRAVARSAAEELAALEVPRAYVIIDGDEVERPVAALRVDDLVRVRPGGRMPVDGVISDGFSELDRSVLTGETTPVLAAPGQAVSAGEVNLTGPLIVRATAVGSDTSLRRMAELVAVAESGRSRYTSLADKAAKLYAPGVHILSGLAFLGWFLWSGDLRVALNIAAAVLIITCPCALGLAVPAVTTAASGRLFRRGLLIKDATALERLAPVDTVVFDKTGTLTTGLPEVIDDGGPDKFDPDKFYPDEVLSVALALSNGSAHPLSVGLARFVKAKGVAPATITDLVEIPGYGTQAAYQGQIVRLGRADWLGANSQGDKLDNRLPNETSTWLSIGGGRPHVFRFTDALREGVADAVAQLQAAGKDIQLISGDSAAPVEAMAKRLGIVTWVANARPEEKSAAIENLQSQGRHVLMVGDGLNDTGALVAADVSISPASALDAARVASDVVLLGQNMAPIAEACAVAQLATSRIRQNFRIATIYNIIAVPLAVAGLATPLIAALAMSTSSITVSLNALRLRS